MAGGGWEQSRSQRLSVVAASVSKDAVKWGQRTCQGWSERDECSQPCGSCDMWSLTQVAGRADSL